MFGKVLVANRGEIAVRVLRALREAGIRGVAVYSDVDRASLHVRLADEAYPIGPAPAASSYLDIGRILDAARRSGAEAVHPGYGFLSENAEFAAACEAAGLVFIGPPSQAIRRMGSKTEARRVAQEAGVEVVPGAGQAAGSAEEAARAAERLGYPVLLKASAGGGGKGMRPVAGPAEIGAAFRDAASEAERAFGDGTLYVEKRLARPRHIEVQVLADAHGNAVHLGERECSVQRRHQKIIEECPSPLAAGHPRMRTAMGDAALRVARNAGYINAGTIEFLVDAENRFYFLEMNTRLQVEHPVTELVAGLDLVQLQLQVAAGERLPFRQEEVAWRGSAIECRVYAEDPENHFYPSPGRITAWREPGGPGVRVDSGVYSGWNVPLEYDPLLAKLVAWAPDRASAIARLERAIGEFHATGVKTTLDFFSRLLRYDAFRRGALHTGIIEEFLATEDKSREDRPEIHEIAALVAAIHASPAEPGAGPAPRAGLWRSAGRSRQLR
jgi:acetyl-CoA carboxylase biotin carboxylase subunit